ncbi:DUF3906 family protein [Bacillus xiapuensis]|uniref:DUF3906 family protein n=1 Tax=Bacillus xiapuensis TaxID=2014075 RepID=UPI000C241472|nr:DUF3906 family protein [Bacillus xiapuensis]
MYIYRFEIKQGESVTYAVIAAENDAEAFDLAEAELEKYYLTLPDYDNITLFEKKRIGGGGGFVLPVFRGLKR